MTALFWIIFGAILAVALIGTFVASAYIERSQSRATMQRIGNRSTSPDNNEPPRAVLYEPADATTKKSLPERLPGIGFMTRQVTAAGLQWKSGAVLLSMAGLALVGVLIGSRVRVLIFPELSAAGLAIVLGWLPYLYIARKRDKRLTEFERQFPDTLDFIARAVSAGHALSVSLELLSNDAPEPTRTEFRRAFTEHNLGASLDAALKGLVQRVPLMDVRFFVSAVLLQRETGGNLSEILTNLGDVIRDRFMLKGKVKAASAHGRMTAIALTLIPIALLLMLAITSPNYLSPLREDRHGRIMALGAIAGQIIGYLAIKKIINIKV
jgi:tight adherence protein B